MKEKPILFSAPMVRAILDGRKTQTRRVVKKAIPDESFINAPYNGFAFVGQFNGGTYTVPFLCPYGQPGDRLWVRETHYIEHGTDPAKLTQAIEDGDVLYRADGHTLNNGPDDWAPWTPSIYMPRWASRITLEITNVRVERLKDISEADARAEGAREVDWEYDNGECPESCKEAFKCLWNHINGPDSWAANPWVWVIEFKRIKP